MQFFDAASTHAALPFARLIPALRERFAAGCEVPLRHVHVLPGAGGDALTSLIMPAWLPGCCYGVKVVNVAPGNAALGLPGLHASYLLHDARTGVPLAWIDGDALTTRRTAATAALAADLLAPAGARRLLLVGSGRVARWLPQAYRTVRLIEQVEVWSRDPAHAQALAVTLAADGFAARAVAALEPAVRAADIVSCATLSKDPLVHGRWLQPGSHLDLIGSFTPQMCEADDDCFAGAAVYIGSDEALSRSGDLLGPLARGVFTRADVRGTLAQLVRGEATAPDTAQREAGRRTVFKSVGNALEDLAAAMLVVASAGTR